MYVYQCTYCGRKFTKARLDSSLGEHKDKNGFKCPGRHGYYVDTKLSMNEILKDIIEEAVRRFMAERPCLIEIDVHEQAVSHRIAFHLESVLGERKIGQLHVDCEYNKHIEGSKNIALQAIPRADLLKCRCWACAELAKKRLPPRKEFRPDILMHHRTDDESNRLAIEIKKDRLCPFDADKLRALTLPRRHDGEYAYELGVFIYFPQNIPEYRWFYDAGD